MTTVVEFVVPDHQRKCISSMNSIVKSYVLLLVAVAGHTLSRGLTCFSHMPISKSSYTLVSHMLE
jgi:hypothetical protein